MKMWGVAVSGGFDPLHIGHIEYLELAAEKLRGLDEPLYVILNSDAFLKRKKGYSFMPYSERKRVLESLTVVWMHGGEGNGGGIVKCIDKDQTVCKTLAKLKPRLFCKGGDRFAHEIPEAAICKKLGIEIVDGLGKKIDSSSKLVARAAAFEKKKKSARPLFPLTRLWPLPKKKYTRKDLGF